MSVICSSYCITRDAVRRTDHAYRHHHHLQCTPHLLGRPSLAQHSQRPPARRRPSVPRGYAPRIMDLMGMKTSFTKNPTNPMTIRPTAVRRQICWYSARPRAKVRRTAASVCRLSPSRDRGGRSAGSGGPAGSATAVPGPHWGPTRCPSRPRRVLHHHRLRLALGGGARRPVGFGTRPGRWRRPLRDRGGGAVGGRLEPRVGGPGAPPPCPPPLALGLLALVGQDDLGRGKSGRPPGRW